MYQVRHGLDHVSDRVFATRIEEPSMAVQSEKDNCDLNVIMKRYATSGVLPVVQVPPTFQEFGEAFDFQSSMNVIRRAEESFMAMPADVRSRFNNDPHLFVNFCMEEKNLDEMRKLGLAIPAKEEPKAPDPVP